MNCSIILGCCNILENLASFSLSQLHMIFEYSFDWVLLCYQKDIAINIMNFILKIVEFYSILSLDKSANHDECFINTLLDMEFEFYMIFIYLASIISVSFSSLSPSSKAAKLPIIILLRFGTYSFWYLIFLEFLNLN